MPAKRRRGLTLIEMLMATAITLLMMAAVVTLFANLSGSISNRRAIIELSGQLRQARQRLARDLAGCTVPPGPSGLMPWRQRAGEAIGYFEILEGDRNDFRPSRLVDLDTTNGEINYGSTLLPGSQMADVDGGQISDGRGLGDADDVLALTVRSLGEPFFAQLDGFGRVESNLAEVVWYAIENDQVDDPTTPDVDESGGRELGMRTIYRRVLLIAPWLPAGPNYDGKVSMHREWVVDNNNPNGTVVLVPNTLADLTRREYRFAHELDYSRIDLDFPHELDLRDVNDLTDRDYAVLDNALAFDVRVYDPGAPLYLVGSGTAVDPGDPGWRAAVGGAPVSFGAYVDLGWNDLQTYVPANNAPVPLFQQEHRLGWHPRDPNDTLGLGTRGTPAVYDTWTWHYENDGRDQDDSQAGNDNLNDLDPTTGMVDEGTNGRDDDQQIATPNGGYGFNGVDDAMERETSPPYPVPLRGVRVTLRVYERDARQVREASVTNSFVP